MPVSQSPRRASCVRPAITSFLTGLFRDRRQRLPSRHRRCRTTSALESLEDRTLLSVTVPGTFDFFITEPGETDIDLGTDPLGDNPPLPPGFFGAIGPDPSDPFAQAGIPLQGNPPVEDFMRFPPPLILQWVDQHGNVVGPDSRHKVGQILVPENTHLADTVVRRNDDAVFNAVGEAPTVDIEIVALSLKSVEPIVVTYGSSGFKLWDVFVTLDETAVQPVGSIDLTSETFVDGVSVSGTVDNLDLPVAFKVTFREVGVPGNVREVPSALATPTPPFGLPPAQFTNSPGTFSFPVNQVVAEKQDTLLVDVDGDGVVDPGDTIRYFIGIGNFTPDDPTNLSFSDSHPDLTAVPGSLNVSPLANDDSYDTLGGIQLDTLGLGLPSLLDNDVEFLTHTIGGDTFVTSFDPVSSEGGLVNVSPDGHFSYQPPVGFLGTDAFSYTLTDPQGATGHGIVDIDVQQRAIFVDGLGGDDVIGTGTFMNPFRTPVPVNAISNPGDIIYVLDDQGVGTDGGFVLQDDQVLLGEGVPLVLGPTVFVPAGSRPTIGSAGSDAITLGTNNTVRGVNIDSPSGAGIVGLNVGTLTIDEVDVAATGGPGVDIRNGGVDITFDSLSSSGSTTPGINLESLTGDITIHTGTIISTGTSDSVRLNGGAVDFTFDGDITNDGGGAISHITGGHSGTVTFQTGTLLHTNPAFNGNHNSLRFDGADGTYNFAGTTTLNGNSSRINVGVISGSTNNGVFNFGPNTSITTFNGALNILNLGATGQVNYQGNINNLGGNTPIVVRDAAAGSQIDISGGTSIVGGGSASTSLVLRNVDGSFNITTPQTWGSSINPGIWIFLGSEGTFTFANTTVNQNDDDPAVFIDTSAGAGLDATFSNLTLSNLNGPGFVAERGTVTVTGAGNSINATNGIGLDTFNAAIGAGGLTFDSIQTAPGFPATLLTTPEHWAV